MNHKGFTFVELMVAMAIDTLLILGSVTGMRAALNRARLDSATRNLVNQVRNTRWKAITTGREYRLVGFDAEANGDFANQFRVMARKSSAVDWPDVDADPFESATRMAGAWRNMSLDWQGVTLTAADDENHQFPITFDSRGTSAAADAEFNTLLIGGSCGDVKTLRISRVGAIAIE